VLDSSSAQWLQQAELDRREAARHRFEALVSRHHAADWAELNGEPPVEGVVRQALFNDMLVLGQHEPPAPRAVGLPADFVESVIIGSGRPALVLPCSAKALVLPQVVVVAWKPSPASAHAVSGALPLLRAAREVHVASWAEVAGPQSGDDLLAYLRQHGVQAQWQHHATAPRELCHALLEHCETRRADLLVMGCYSRPRLRERVLGGATRSVLRALPLPVLMAH